jgi:hypothetical protein
MKYNIYLFVYIYLLKFLQTLILCKEKSSNKLKKEQFCSKSPIFYQV